MGDGAMITEPKTELPGKARRLFWHRMWGWGAALVAIIGLLALGYTPSPDRPYTVDKIRTLRLKTDPSALAWSPDGKQLAAPSHLFMHVTVWNTDTWEVANEFDISQSMLAANWLMFTPDSRSILVAADPSDVVNKHAAAVFWDVATGTAANYVANPFPNDGDPRRNFPKVIALSSDGKMLAMRTIDRAGVQLGLYVQKNWSKPDALISLDKSIVQSMAFSPDGGLLAFGDYRGWFDFLDLQTRKFMNGFQAYDFNGEGVSALAFSPDGHLIATGYGGPLGKGANHSADEPIQLIDVSTARILSKSPASSPKIWDLSRSSDGKMLAASDSNGHVSLLRPPALEKVASDIGLDGPVLSVKFAPDRPVFVATSGKNIAVYEVARR